jgi:polyphosphate glucokinase
MKAGLVDVSTGLLASERVRVRTPQPANPSTMADAAGQLVEKFEYSGPIGIGFPAVVQDGTVLTAMNIDEAWVGESARDIFGEATSRDVTILNDADAAALAEAKFGVARDVAGLVLVLTFGTGIGSGMLVDGQLVPNVELGVIELEGHRPAELFFSAKAREAESLSWEEWGDRANRFLTHVNRLFAPKLIVVGGGVAKRWDRFAHRLDSSLAVELAAMGHNAGIVGAAISARR